MEVDEDYAQRISPVSSLRAILEAYPLSVGILRELVQNSDDAGASKQVWLVDLNINHLSLGADICFRSSKSLSR
jgi:hypothetical protein